MLNVVIGYPSAADERAIIAQTTTGAERTASPVTTADAIERARGLVREVVAADNIIDYATRLVRATRPGAADEAPEFVRQWIRWGAGPRAGQSLLLAGKARAVLHGRPAVSLDDIRAVALPVLRHRVLVNFQAEADGVDAETVVARLLGETPAR
jgi:MoxR-like ATPase